MVHPFLRAGIALAAAIAGVAIVGGIDPTQPAVALTAPSKALSKTSLAKAPHSKSPLSKAPLAVSRPTSCPGCDSEPFRMKLSDLAARPLPPTPAKATSRIPAFPIR